MKLLFNKLFKNKKDYPEFWQNYSAKFKNHDSARVVVLDCETTGLKPTEDKILSVGAVALHNKIIYIEDNFRAFLKQKINKPESIAIHGIVKNKTDLLVPESEALEQLLSYLGNSKIIGHHIQFDVHMINIALKNAGLPKLKNKVQDTSDLYSQYKGVHQLMRKSLDELCDEFHITKKDRHTSMGDAFLTAQVYQRLILA